MFVALLFWLPGVLQRLVCTTLTSRAWVLYHKRLLGGNGCYPGAADFAKAEVRGACGVGAFSCAFCFISLLCWEWLSSVFMGKGVVKVLLMYILWFLHVAASCAKA